MDKAQMDEENQRLNYPGSWDKCQHCHVTRNAHSMVRHPFYKEGDINLVSEGVDVVQHNFVNIPGTPNCGRCELGKDSPFHTKDSGPETYRKPIYTRYDLIPAIALRQLAQVYHEGAITYGNSKYIMTPMPHSNVVNHMINHLEAARSGDRSELHWAKVAWAAFTMMVYEELGIGLADLSPYGVIPSPEPNPSK